MKVINFLAGLGLPTPAVATRLVSDLWNNFKFENSL